MNAPIHKEQAGDKQGGMRTRRESSAVRSASSAEEGYSSVHTDAPRLRSQRERTDVWFALVRRAEKVGPFGRQSLSGIDGRTAGLETQIRFS